MCDRLTCDTCGNKIPNGQAVIRSISFQQVAFHKPGQCPKVPAQPAHAEHIAVAS